MTTPSTQNTYLISSGTTTLYPTVVFARAPNIRDFNFPITQRWINTADNNQEYFLLNFRSSLGIVEANWVILNAGSSGSGVQFLKGDSGGQVPPDGTSTINLLGTGSITTAGDAGTNTITTQLFGLVAHNVLVGVSPDTIGNIPNAIDIGIPLISQGGIADPAFGTALIIGGGTGSISFATNGVVITGATPITPLSSITLNNGQLPIGSTGASPVAANLTSTGGSIVITNGPGSINLETSGGGGGGAFNQIVTQVFVTSGVYTPTAGMVFAVVECVGAGGGGGGVNRGGAGGVTGEQGAGGGGGGGYARSAISAATIGVSQIVTVGVGGTGGNTSGGDGGAGGTSTFGAPVLVSASGGNGGSGQVANQNTVLGGIGGIGTIGSINSSGNPGGPGECPRYSGTPSGLVSGEGGSSPLGGGGRGVPHQVGGVAQPGNVGRAYGGGGSGAVSADPSPAGAAGGNGASGVVIVTEYIHV